MSQKRVENLMNVTAAAIAAYVQSQLHGVDLWARPFVDIKGSLIGASQVMARLADEFRDLSGDWKIGVDNGGHTWTGPALTDPYVEAFRQRLEEVYTMRETHDELCRLLGQHEAQSLGAAEVFTPLAHLPVLQVSEYNMPAWRSGKEDFERRMEPLEQRISQKLREMFGATILPALISAVTGDAAVQPQQVFQDLRRFGGLLSRPAVASALTSEKEALAKQVDKHVDALQGALDERQGAADSGTKYADGHNRNPSNVVDHIMWALKTQHKLARTQEVLRLMLGTKQVASGDGSSSSLHNCLSVAAQLSKEVEAFKKQQFEIWEAETQEQLSSMAAWKNSKLMTFDSQNHHVKTHFNDQLVVLLREVRQLQSLGFSIKRNILNEVETANRFYRYGMVLKQRANFYNNIATEMIPCQKPMLLQDAMDFEKVLMNPKDSQGKEITWRSAAALEGYVKRLNDVAERLAEKTRQLRKWHDVLRDKVVALMNTDLVRYKDRWAVGVKEMRDIFLRLENEGYTREAQQVWRQHWDFQLFKALEYQYIQGLTCINQALPEIDIKMVFRQHKLQYDPPLEDIRIKHYKDHLNTFLGLPLRMKGVSDLSERPGFFRPIVDAAPQGIAKVYAAAEALFGQLAEELKRYQDWMVLGTVDLDEFVDANLTEVSDWELNFKVLKAAARDAERLPNEVKVDCYNISLVPVKTVVDEQLKRLQETLVASLRRKANDEKTCVEEYIKNGRNLFGKQAATVEDIGVAGQEARHMVDGLNEIQQIKRRIDEKNKLLRAMASGGNSKDAAYATVDVSEVNNAWEAFTTQLQQFDASLEDQKQQLGVAVTKQLEEFRGNVAGFASRWEELKPKGGPSGNPAVVLSKIQAYAVEVQELKEESAKLQKEAEAFKMDVGGFEVLDEVANDVAITSKSWNRYAEFLGERNEMANKEWLSMREQVWKIEDFLSKWREGPESASKDEKDPINAILSQEIRSYELCLPHLKTTMRGAGWEDTHWLQLFKMLGLKTSGEGSVSRETVTLAHFLDVADKVVSNADAIKSLDAQAQGEAMIRKALAELKLWGQNREFSFSEPVATLGRARGRPIVLIKEWRDVQAEVGDHQSLVASLRQSSYYHLFKDEVASWEMKLSVLQEGLMLLNQIQRKWVYLEPIFGRGALPAQQARFRNVDEEFKRVMYQLESNKLVVSFAEIIGIRDKLPQMAQQLDVCQRALSDFLEDKRSSFPRFYFLGDDDLLEILGQAQNPSVIQSHLKKLFAGIHKVKFSPNHSSITSMQSMAGEVVELATGVQVTDSIETWLNSLATCMQSVMAGQLQLVCSGRMGDEFKVAASQTLCLKEAISFTDMVEKALRQQNGIARVAKDMSTALEQLAASDYTGSTLLQLKKQALVLDFIHYLDVVEQLTREQTSSPSDWAWTRQLRYYAAEGGGVDVCMAEASFQYTWEYQGNAPKLVYTPLTDKCYLTLTQGMALGYGGNPYGPAGTGKTESVKALGQALARQVLVFNCDEEFDFRAMGRIFVGLVKCGAWGCFDEFNRLDEEVLSAVSQQIQIIQGALKEGAATMEFMDKTVEVDKNAGIFVTLNPAGKGYGGRSKLPDNLKQLFRSIAMTVPNNEQIAEVLLVSEGFKHAKVLARKLVTLFSLSRELLSQQQHYDWGLRALKTSLGIAGRELREVRKAAGASNTTLSEPEEMEIIVRAVCATKLPTLTFDDNRGFIALINDLFTNIKITDSKNPDLEAAIKTVSKALKIELTPPQVDKILQLHLACEQRIGIIIVGPSGSGKSTLWEVLEKAYEQLGKRPLVFRMNPKAMARQQLLGSMNLDTREWSDGVLTAAARRVVKEPLEQRCWIVCDGDVDPEWIESLNSVLDDNRLLTMPNGERIQFANNVNFIFECHSLEFASPATVSRCGMLFMSDEALEVKSLVDKWIVDHTDDNSRSQMQSWFKDYFFKAFEWGLSRPSAVETTKVGLLSSALSHLGAEDAGTKHDFVVALARGVGANMTPEVRADFYADLTRMTGESGFADDMGAYGADPLMCLGEDLREGTLGGDGVDLVMTPEALASLSIIAPWFKTREPFILVGPDGCGKSTLLEHCFSRIVGCSVATVHCSAQTNAANVVQKLVQVCGKPVTTAIGKCLRPPDNARIILFLKDINLPRPDKYNTSQLVAFLQQLLSHGGYYDENLEFIHVQRVQIIGCMSPPSTVGRHALSTRFTARVRVACLAHPDISSLQSVYTSIIEKVLPNTRSIGPAYLAKAMLEVYGQVSERFTVNEQAHYQFSPRDVTAWVHGLKRYELDSGLMSLADAFGHEACRIFRDRLVGQEALESFDGTLSVVMSTQLRSTGSLSGWTATTLGCTNDDRIKKSANSTRLSRWEMNDLQSNIAGKLKSYEREIKELHMLLFPEVLERLARFDRVLAEPGGSLLLCGPSGTGRRSCMLLLAYMHQLNFFTPKMNRSYDLKSFRSDLKEVLKATGVEGKPTLLFLEDHQLIDPAFLELVNSLLSGGEVPGLFTNEELNKELAPLEQQKNEDPTYTGPNNTYVYFTHRVSQNLHIAISMDPSNDLFRPRCESNPALLSRCAVQWLDRWSDSTKTHIARMRLKEASAGGASKNATRQSISDQDMASLVSKMVLLHNSMLSMGATPRQYMAFVQLYNSIYSNKRKQVLEQQGFLKTGLTKLAEAESTVDDLSAKAGSQREELKLKQADAEEALVRIQSSMMQAADRRKEVEILKKRQAKEEVELKGRRGGVEEELKGVQPLIDQARKAVGGIKKENIDEIRSLKMPPDAIRDVLEGVLLVLGQQDTSWNNMKKFLGAKAVKDEIVNFDARKVNPSMRASVNKLLSTKGNSFEPAVIQRVSVAAAPLASWVKAIMAYSKVLERTAPLEQELSGLVASLQESATLIVQYEKELATCDEQVSILRADFAKRTSEAESLRTRVEKAEATVNVARDLLGKLSGEKQRWSSQVQTLQVSLSNAPLDALLTSAFITYLPGHSEDVRARVEKMWMQQLGVQEYNFCHFMSSEGEMLRWKGEGLPADNLSMQNGVVILNASLPPLIIDPSTQASKWLEAHLRAISPTLEVTSMHDPRFVNSLELAVRFGKTLIVQEVDRIEPVLYPLLRQDLARQGPRFVVDIGDKQIDYNETFRLYLVTRHPDPYLPPDASSLVSTTNFTVTRSGLEGQLLGLTLQQEQPELEEKKSTLLQQEEDLKVQLADLEKQLLQTLATSQGSLLENKELLDSLNASQVKSQTVAAGLAHSRELQASLDVQREMYRPIAKRGSTMYFLIKDLSTINHMYRFSLSVFTTLFKKALNQDTPAGDITTRITLLSGALLDLVLSYVARSLFNADRLMLGMHMARHMKPEAVQPEEWDFFLGKPHVDVTSSQVSRPPWVHESCAAAFALLAANFPKLVQACELMDGQLWGPWVAEAAGDGAVALPGRVASKVSPFQALLLVLTFRPDRLEAAMNGFVCAALNVKGVVPLPFSLKDLVERESNASQPVLFTTTPGADPTTELAEYANATIGRDRYFEVAMGQGQADIALNLLRECARSGDWLCLKNLHLAVSWLPTLEKEMYTLTKADSFRLFLSTEPHSRFPTTLLEGSLKITVEAPPGVKKNLQRTYEGWSSQLLAAGPPMHAQLMFVLAWFHAVVQERRSFIPQGWSKFYEFSTADLRSGADVVMMALKGADGSCQWKMLHGLLENAIYGGRVDNDLDAKVLRAYLQQYFNAEIVGQSGRVKPLPGTRVAVPSSKHKEDYMQVIADLPDSDPPAIFSLPANIGRAAQQVHGQKVVQSLKAMSLASTTTTTFNSAQWQAQLGPLLRLWDTLASQAAPLKAAVKEVGASRRGKNASAPSSPVDAFVALERLHAVKVVETVGRTLNAINKVLRGQATLSSTVKASGQQLLVDEVPSSWEALWAEGPTAPSDFIRSVVRRGLAIEDWWAKVQAGSLLNSGPLDLSQLFHPGPFLNALRQQTARATKVPLDHLKLGTCWDMGRLGQHAIQVGGLLVQGATFDGTRLGPLAQDSPISRAVPPMGLAWLHHETPLPYAHHISTPLYSTQDRAHVLIEVQLPIASQEEEVANTLAGLALFMTA